MRALARWFARNARLSCAILRYCPYSIGSPVCICSGDVYSSYGAVSVAREVILRSRTSTYHHDAYRAGQGESHHGRTSAAGPFGSFKQLNFSGMLHRVNQSLALDPRAARN
jgi:hypothetical protein